MPSTSSSIKKRSAAAGVENHHPNASSTQPMSKNPFAKGSTVTNARGSQDRKRRAFVQNNNNNNRAEATKGKRHKHSGTKMRPMPSLVEALCELTPSEKEGALAKIESEFDRNLQILLFEVDCNYVLLEHQFLGVRALAGVPEDFPGLLKLKDNDDRDDAIFDWVVKVLRNSKPRREGNDRGVLMADSMGLGKTVQAVCACILRNAIALTKDQKKLPTLICSPNDAVLTQWQETLVKAGVERRKIYRFEAKKPYKLKGDIYVLCNRYNLQTEVRYMWGGEHQKKYALSALLPNAKKKMMDCLKNQYLAAKGKVKNEHIDQGDLISVSDVITDCLAEYAGIKRTYQTVCIDESHFLKSLETYWGCAAGMLGLHAERMVVLSGTPYCNGPQDLASQMTMVDPIDDSAHESWWKQATASSNAQSVVAAISQWNEDFLIRRGKEVIAKNLPKKTTTIKPVGAYPLELSVYEYYEKSFLDILGRFEKLQLGVLNPVAMKRMKEYFELMLAFAGCMRSSLIHPVIPGGGRDMTILFSPSRQGNSSILKSLERRNRCVCCRRQVKPTDKLKSKKRSDNLDNLEDQNINDEDDDQFISNEEEDEEEAGGFGSFKGTGNIDPLPDTICTTAGHGIRHYACESCIKSLKDTGASCPLCTNLLGRLHLDSGRQEILKKKKEVKPDNERVAVETQPEDMAIPRRVYCSEVLGGFKPTAKLESIVDDFRKLPKDEKCLIVSFFKGSLDLLEGIFDELGAETARFDGDISSDERENELDRFKTQASCRILLMTVQTGGTGLNLVCSNHVWFVDRFWNPMVMDQCEDRCHRLGQTKDVDITYHDVSMTIDDVLRQINITKATNAMILLSNGVSLASAATAGLSYADASGQLGSAVSACRNERVQYIMSNPKSMNQPLPASDVNLIDLPRGNQRGDVSSLIDAISSSLGYGLPDHVPRPARKAVPDQSPGSGVPNSGSDGSSMSMADVGSKTSSEAGVPSKSMSFLDDSSDDDSIPDALVFGSKKKKSKK